MSNLDVAIQNLNPHYTNDRFREVRVVWGHKANELDWDYSDRLWSWDWDKSDKASKSAREKVGNTNTARYFQEYLSEYFGKEIELVCIMAGWNWATGYAYRVFGYREAKDVASRS